MSIEAQSQQVWYVQVFMVARDNGTTYNGLARSCTPTSRLPALASGCSTTAFADCNQVWHPFCVVLTHVLTSRMA